jgi:hypothetical protein
MHDECVTYDLIHHGLFSVPSDVGSWSAVYWLRLFRKDRCGIAIVTEVPLNPGLPMYMNESEIGIQIQELFGIEYVDLTFYRILPRGYPDPEAPSIFNKAKRIVSRAELEALVGLPLPTLPDDPELRIKVIELGGKDVPLPRLNDWQYEGDG